MYDYDCHHVTLEVPDVLCTPCCLKHTRRIEIRMGFHMDSVFHLSSSSTNTVCFLSLSSQPPLPQEIFRNTRKRLYGIELKTNEKDFSFVQCHLMFRSILSDCAQQILCAIQVQINQNPTVIFKNHICYERTFVNNLKRK